MQRKPYDSGESFQDGITMDVYNQAIVDRRNLEIVNANLIKQVVQLQSEIVSLVHSSLFKGPSA
jgi:hypothetical protein